ncbi:MAG TPA: hypothetical protein VLE69_01390 [Candidatus Saccharimonadales bacterium]|nr:hypothetical protein [Candidatus Saccharimonadales bacterium]
MKSCEFQAPRVPDQLEPLIDDRLLEIHGEWQELSLSDVKAQMPNPITIATNDGQGVRAAILKPTGFDGDMSQALVIDLPHQQAWKPSMYIRSEITRQVVAPELPAVVFPNNSLNDLYYDFTDSEYERLDNGDISPLAEKQVRILEELNVAKIAITGYSLGGKVALGVGDVGSDTIEITHINADEAPSSVERSAKELQKDFLQSGGWGEQCAAIRDARLPVLSQALNMSRLLMDYARFGVATRNKQNRAIHNAMTDTVSEVLLGTIISNPDVKIKMGRVGMSNLVIPTFIYAPHSIPESPNFREIVYTGDAAHKHATGDNVFAHALMAKHGISTV